MAYQNLSSIAWGTGPDITGTIAYDYQRSGADMLYRIKITINTLPYSISYFGYPIYATIKLDGTARVSTHQIKAASPSQWSSALVYETDWLTVSGKSSGTTTLRVNLFSGSGESRDVNYDYALYVVPAASTMTFSAFTMGDAGSIGIIRADSGYTHTIGYQFGSASGTIATKSDALSISWTPPLELAWQIPDSSSGTGVLTIDTYLENTKIAGKEYSFTLYVPSNVQPTAVLSITAVNDNTAINRWDVCVKGYSKLVYTVTADGAYGAAIQNCQFSFADKTATGLSGTVETGRAGCFAPSARVTDSRGRSITVTGDEVTVYDYCDPTIADLRVQRCNAAGTVQNEGTYVRVQGNFQAGATVGGRNGVTASCRYREIGGSWSSYTTIASGSVIIGGHLLATKTYEAEICVKDSVGGSKTVSAMIPTAEVAFHLREGGKGAAFGKYAEKNALECAWDVEIKGKPLLDWIYPVGAIYLSVNAANPATLFGGTWTRIKDSFLLAAGDTHAAGTSGGEETHKLTKAELPRINGSFSLRRWQGVGDAVNAVSGVFSNSYDSSGGASMAGNSTTGNTQCISMSFGGDGAHNNMPPYLAVYVWKRTA